MPHRIACAKRRSYLGLCLKACTGHIALTAADEDKPETEVEQFSRLAAKPAMLGVRLGHKSEEACVRVLAVPLAAAQVRKVYIRKGMGVGAFRKAP